MGVQDRKWPPSPDRINHGHASEQTTSNILKGLSVSVDRHFSSEALISWQMHLFLVSSKNRELLSLNVKNYTSMHFIFKEEITGELSFLQRGKRILETYLDLIFVCLFIGRNIDKRVQ